MKQINLAEKNGNWKGDDIDRSSARSTGLHMWVKRRLVKPELCQMCNKNKPQDLANISGNYLRDLTDWQYLCRRCHMISDGRMNRILARNKTWVQPRDLITGQFKA